MAIIIATTTKLSFPSTYSYININNLALIYYHFITFKGYWKINSFKAGIKEFLGYLNFENIIFRYSVAITPITRPKTSQYYSFNYFVKKGYSFKQF